MSEFEDFLNARVVSSLLTRMAGEGASAEGSKAESRKKESDKLFEEMKSLKPKVDNAEKSAATKFDRAFDKLFANGEAAYKASEKLLKKFGEGDHPDVPEKSEAWFALELMHKAMRDWNLNKLDHHQAKSEFAQKKFLQAGHTWGYATKMDEWIISFSKEMKG